MQAYQCSNPLCGRLHAADPRGHCPACRRPDGSGYSTFLVEAAPCRHCGAPCSPDAPFGRCDDCLAAAEYAMSEH